MQRNERIPGIRAEAAHGPFFGPADRKVYLDLGFTARVASLRKTQTEAEANATSARVGLQADCYAGVSAKHANPDTHGREQGDVASAPTAASSLGDDALQRAARYPVSDPWPRARRY